MSFSAWTSDPLVLAGVGLMAALYARGWRRSHVPLWRAACFAGGLLTIAVALESPIAAYDQQLFALHMAEHTLLMLVAAPLLLLGRPLAPLLWGLPSQERRGTARVINRLASPGRLIGHPVITTTVFLLSQAIWHLPPVYDQAQAHTPAHYAEHVSFFASALLFWWPVIQPHGRVAGVAGSLYFLAPMFEGTLIGAVLTFASRPFYSTYALAPRLAGLNVSAVDDQQLAGLIMWIPSGIVYASAALWLVWTTLREAEVAGLEPQAPVVA